MMKDSGNNPNVAKCVYVAPTKVCLGFQKFCLMHIVFSGSMFGKI